ncbi:MAG: glycosyltransferase family 39 protein [Bacteroidota bacterium]|nr:glycosyltransferase family 39 protein [Bacteroidota bacterium]
MKEPNKIIFLALFILALAVNFAGINVKFFTDDPGLYAAISKNLIYKKSFLELFTYNRDWLDKPHFPFWLVLFSFKAFGISEWAYRLPALLFFALSLLYTWLFAVKYYSREIAFTAVLIVMTALHVLLSNTDVRAEPYLMGLLMGSVYHVACLQERYSFKHLLLAALLIASAVMTKGIFVIIPVGGALFGQLVFQKRLGELLSLKWLALIVLTIIFTIPELYALYIQFDLHPEKTVFGTNHVSGLKWFLWDSQFGRFINAGPISRAATGSKFFYLHTLLWAFAPWCLLFYYAVFKNVKNIFKGVRLTEYYTLSGGLLLLLLFSFSGFQLPFYTNAVFPLFAIVTAPFCVNQLSKFGTALRAISLWIFAIALPLVVVALNYLLKPANNLFFVADISLFGIMIFLILKSVKENYKRIFFACCAAALFAGFYLNTVFYNEIVSYRGEIAAASYLNQKPFDNFKIYSLKFENNIFQFYSKKPIDYLPIEEFKNFRPQQTSLFYVSQRSMDYLVQTHAEFTVVHSFIDYPQENLKPNFLNRATRATVLGKVYLISKP